MKNLIIIAAALIGIFCLLFFSRPPKSIHYIFAIVLAIVALKGLFNLLVKK